MILDLGVFETNSLFIGLFHWFLQTSKHTDLSILMILFTEAKARIQIYLLCHDIVITPWSISRNLIYQNILYVYQKVKVLYYSMSYWHTSEDPLEDLMVTYLHNMINIIIRQWICQNTCTMTFIKFLTLLAFSVLVLVMHWSIVLHLPV